MTPTEIIVSAYTQIGVPLDRLPYTFHMDRVVKTAHDLGLSDVAYENVWRELVSLRKNGRLPKVGRLKTSSCED